MLNSEKEEMVTITKKLYNQLTRDARILRALEAGGVDNWEGYEASLENCDMEVPDA